MKFETLLCVEYTGHSSLVVTRNVIISLEKWSKGRLRLDYIAGLMERKQHSVARFPNSSRAE